MNIILIILFCIVLFFYLVVWSLRSMLRSLFFPGKTQWVKGTRTREGGAGRPSEGEVTIRQTSAPQPKRVRKDVGDYVDYKEVKPE